MSTQTLLHEGVEVVLLENARSYTCGVKTPPLAAGTRAVVESAYWDGATRRVCILTVDPDETGYRRFAIVSAGKLGIAGEGRGG